MPEDSFGFVASGLVPDEKNVGDEPRVGDKPRRYGFLFYWVRSGGLYARRFVCFVASGFMPDEIASGINPDATFPRSIPVASGFMPDEKTSRINHDATERRG